MKPACLARCLSALLITGVVTGVQGGWNRAALAGPPEGFFEFFETRGMRLDLIHSGTAKSETYSLDQVREEPIWGGPFGHLTDMPDLGKHRVSVYDRLTGRLVYRYGFSSLFGEWQTTAEAASGRVRAIEEAVRFPMPRRPVKVVIETRNESGVFDHVSTFNIDPGAAEVDRGRRFQGVRVIDLEVNGPPESTVDVLLLGDGYAPDESGKFERDAARFMRVMLGTSPFKELRSSLSVRAIQAPSPESGPDEPRRNVFVDTGLSATFNTFGSARYLTTARSRDMRDLAALAPYDTIVIMVNSSRYGGGGIFGLYSVFVSDNEFDEYIMVHEFGHGFAGLGDEYYSSSVAYSEFYPRGVEPWEPNITALLKGRPLKWEKMVEPGTPIPTPADRGRYGGKVGAFEGAGYSARGLYRPTIDCKMFSKGNKPFCPVCADAIRDMVDLLTDPGD